MMKRIGLLLLITSCTAAQTTLDTPTVAQTRADALYVTLSPKAARAVAAAIASGELHGSATKIAGTNNAEAWSFEGLEPSELSLFLHEHFHHCGGFIVYASQADAEDALDDSTAQFAENTEITYTLDNAERVDALTPNVDAANIHATIMHLSSYTNRYYKNPSGVEAAKWIAAQWQTLADTYPGATVELFTHSFTQPSVIMTIPGVSLPNEVVVLGAHLDSIAGWSPGPNTSAPGADDDASGIASLTETMRVLLASGFKPQRTLKMMGYAGEEAGLLGSSDITKKYAADQINVIGVLQMDMTNYVDGGSDEIVLINDYTNVAQNNFVGALIDAYVKVPWGQMPCDYACSDHASWTKRGFAASFPFETHDYNPNIHTANDTMDAMVQDATHAAKFSRLAIAYVIELAKPAL